MARSRRGDCAIKRPPDRHLVGSGYLTQKEFYRLRLLMTLYFLAVFLVVGTAWLLPVAG